MHLERIYRMLIRENYFRPAIMEILSTFTFSDTTLIQTSSAVTLQSLIAQVLRDFVYLKLVNEVKFVIKTRARYH